MDQQVATPVYTLRGVKIFRGMDGIGLNATLLRDGKAVCDLIDEGSGGMMHFRWCDQHHGESPERGLFAAFVEQERAKIPADKVNEHDMNERELFCGETWIDRLVDKLENDKRMRRFFKTSTCYQVGSQIGTDQFYKVKGLGPEIRARILKNPSVAGKSVIFLNDQPMG